MRLEKTIAFLILASRVSFCFAQDLSVKSISMAQGDLTASAIDSRRLDGENVPCALLKVQVDDEITSVVGGVVGDVVSQGIEKWIYLKSGTNIVRFNFAKYHPLTLHLAMSPDISLDKGVQSLTTYVVLLTDSENVFDTYTVNGVSFRMRNIDGGTFLMGSADGSESNSMPVHEVTLSNYSIGETEVTMQLWAAVMGGRSNSTNPVVNVTWDDCQQFLTSLRNKTGFTFRLPTEAEWEFAACGGKFSAGYRYSGGNDIDSVAWHGTNADAKVHPVGELRPNELGLYDMSGNVYEWCNDWFDKYSKKPVANPLGPSKGKYRVYRGGSFSDVLKITTIRSRSMRVPEGKMRTLGFRLCKD